MHWKAACAWSVRTFDARLQDRIIRLEVRLRLAALLPEDLRPRIGELGFWLGQDYWGHGFATEASRAVVTYAFTVGNLEALTSANFIDNPASARILAKLGFSANGRMRAQSLARGHDIDCTTWRLEREAAQLIYRLPPVAASAAGGWTRLRALLSGR